MKSLFKLFVFFILLIFLGSIGLAIYWIVKTSPTLTQIELYSFGAIDIKSESIELSDEEKKKHLTMVPIDPEGLKSRIDGEAQLFSFVQHSWDGMASHWTSNFTISIEKARFIVFDVTNKVPTFGYDKENKYFNIKQNNGKNDSNSSGPIPSLKSLKSTYQDCKIIEESSANLTASVPVDQNKEDSWPLAMLLLPDNAHYFYEWKENSSLFIQEATLKDSPDKMGLGFQHFLIPNKSTGFLSDQGGAKMSMRVGGEDDKTYALLILTNNLDILIRDKTIKDPNKKFLIYVEFSELSGDIKISIPGPDPSWYAYAKSPESFSFSVDLFNHNLSILDPEGSFSILNNEKQFREIGELSAKFDDFPNIGTEDYYRFSRSKNTSPKKILVRGMATSFEFQGVQYITGRWAAIPSDIRGAIIGALMGLLVFLFTKLIDMMSLDKVQKVQIIHNNSKKT
jgi:hypothetical protein